MSQESLFLTSLPVIDEVTLSVCRRHRFSGPESEDFAAEVHLHFIDQNYEVLRRFEGRSSLPTYVTIVIQRQFLDYRNRLWGQVAAVRSGAPHGPDGYSDRAAGRPATAGTLDQVVETLRVNSHGVTLD